MPRDDRTPILYLAPWIDLGGSDKATLDWFRWLDRERFVPHLITTQASSNRRLEEARAYAGEVWALPDLMPAQAFPGFIFDFIDSRGIELVHIMNSRIGFDLLPDLSALPRRPATVVQLHVEEVSRDGYVRYVTTRYGNLIDAYSVSGHHLATAMADYDVPRAKLRVIHTGVDPEWEFSPERIIPQPVPADRFNVLYAARLVEQKDPQLMLTVAAQVAERHPELLVHVVGDGPLEAELRARARELDLDRHLTFHGPATGLESWYAACDTVLMTSRFEGIPCTVFEAMAMSLPMVAPALPGLSEAMAGGGGVLVDPRDDVAAYVEALSDVAGDKQRRQIMGETARAHVTEHFGIRRMADEHAALYDELLERRRDRSARDAPAGNGGGDEMVAAPDARIVLHDRPSTGTPLVSIITPCFNHGLFLPDALAAIRAQTYPKLEIIVVDDASDDAETVQLMERLESEGWATVIRQPTNQGPSAARNAALAVATGRYILPVDADNLLLPNAVGSLVEQLQSAGATVGFIYPNPRYFGNRDDHFEAPPYNLYALLHGNYCDTCSLFDRAVFDAGVGFAEDIKLGHEDWDLMLQLADRGVRGEPAHGETLLYRKHGFTRSDTVEYAHTAFHEEIIERHAGLFGDPRIKPRDCPGLSVVLLELAEETELQSIAARLSTQTYTDLELIAAFDGTWPRPDDPMAVRRIPPGEAPDATVMLELGLSLARAPRVLVVTDGFATHLGDPAHLEKLVRLWQDSRHLDAIAMIDTGEPRHPLAPLPGAAALDAPHAVLLNRAHAGDWPDAVLVPPGDEVGMIVRQLAGRRAEVHFCHLAGRSRRSVLARDPAWVSLAVPAPNDVGGESVRRMCAEAAPNMPRTADPPRRWAGSMTWIPPETVPLVRHSNPTTARLVITNSHVSPEGYSVEWDLGVVQRFSPPGTARLEHAGDEYRVVPRGSERELDGVVELGHVEQAPLPMFDALLIGTHRPTGQTVLLSGDDPLLASTDVHRGLGFIEGFPIHPRRPSLACDPAYRLLGLLRYVDRGARRHVHCVGSPAAGSHLTLAGELGALLGSPDADTIALWIDPSGLVHTGAELPGRESPSVAQLAHWVAAPVAWRGFEHPHGRARSIARRAFDSSRLLARPPRRDAARQDAEPAGYLFAEHGPGRVTLFSAMHPANGDQILTTREHEATDMGYGDVLLLGHLRDVMPVTGNRTIQRVSVPWASRFGLQVRS